MVFHWYDRSSPAQKPSMALPIITSPRGARVTASQQSVEPFDLVIFGGTGDLAAR
jgi:hypothetical protein